MKNLDNKFLKGVKKVWSKAKPVILPVIAGAGLYFATSQDACSQDRRRVFPERHDHGKEIYDSKIDSRSAVEIATLHDSTYYFNYIEKENEEDAGLEALPFYDTRLRGKIEDSDVAEFVSTRRFVFQPARDKNGKRITGLRIEDSHIAGICSHQLKQRAGVAQNVENYILQLDLENLLPPMNTLKMGDGRKFYFPYVGDENIQKGKTHFYLFELANPNEWEIDPVKKDLILYGNVQQGVSETGRFSREAIPGKVSDIYTGELEKKQKSLEPEVQEPTEPKKGNLYLIVGANGNDKFIEGNLGLQYGPVAFVANAGKGFDETIDELKTAPFPDGTYGYGKIDNKEIRVLGISAELHPLHNRKISPFVGGGINNRNYNVNELAQIRAQNGDILSSNSDVNKKSEDSYKGYAGLNFKIGEKSQLGVQAGYDTKTEFNGGIRYTQRF